jgi:hypothetical protein
MMSFKTTLCAAFSVVALFACENENSATASQNDNASGIESRIIEVVSSEDTDLCSVQASWSGDFEGSVDWVPEKSPSAVGFNLGYKSFKIETTRFNLDAIFETPLETGKTGSFEGKATHFYVTDAPYTGPQEMGKVNISFDNENAMGNQVTLEISEWTANRISGSVSAGPFTGVAGGPLAPRDGDGPNSPLKPITVNGSARFQAVGEITSRITGETLCKKIF